MNYYRVLISATSQEEAEKITEILLQDHLIAGGFIFEGLSIHWWQEKIDREKYWNISAFTKIEHKEDLIDKVRKNHQDEVPGIVFFKIDDANQDFLDWIEDNIK
jgi:uncharacterized protein involved in tolerance to divalent cations